MIVALPPVTPVTTPEVNPMVATDILLLVQLPPPASVKVMFDAAHTVPAPLMADGIALTLNVTVLPPDGEFTQPKLLVTVLIVNVVEPTLASPGRVNVPVPPLTVIVAEPVPELAPLIV